MLKMRELLTGEEGLMFPAFGDWLLASGSSPLAKGELKGDFFHFVQKGFCISNHAGSRTRFAAFAQPRGYPEISEFLLTRGYYNPTRTGSNQQ